MSGRRRSNGRVLIAVVFLALCLAPVASAKIKLWLSVSDGTPRVGQQVTVVLRSGVNLPFDLS